ncbi:FGGY-family carbohydrate kinase [Anaerotruncus massiliensis (ex Togo et al. 2019)]|uniref:xylulokinase n=1 Tax=Anaerotruncus massiliensis (ex Togo et al. 2019) TaxID=1673720 RepID=UPI0027B8C604|nr:FGGY family carbohydrate kinase [Anaerotruncus massiliensis (ex Togo et al. 2019)]
MRYIATFDIGTTAVKGVLLSEDNACACEKSVEIETFSEGGRREQDPLSWYAAVREISRAFFAGGISPGDVRGIVMSGQMQDLIPVDGDLRPTCNAILYSDGRAGAEAERLAALIGREELVRSTGNQFDGSLPFPKLLWLKEQNPGAYRAAEKVLISSKDYCIARLTGEFVSDVTASATAGLMDIHEKRWNTAWMEAAGLDSGKLPRLRYAHEQAGAVTPGAAAETGYLPGTPVYTGTGDAGATTLASGISADGEFNINLGTSGWVACVSDDVLPKGDVFNLAAMPEGVYINVVPFFNAGNVHKWVSRALAPSEQGKYDYVDRLLEESEAGSHGTMFLPYLVGERFPVVDTQIRGGYVGVTPETTKQDLARSALEGVAFSIRQGIESIGRVPGKISLIGGGARTPVWCQILADVLGHPVHVYRNSDYLPAVAIAASVLVAQGEIGDYTEFTDTLQGSDNCLRYDPVPANVERYNRVYPRYLRVYPALKTLCGD